ncbi:MAG TPA: DUF6266 family protein [Prolixibacteraceae bacterium]|nr:DUF6266 family protein [Prolixibacteraceae bacterium]
MARLINNGSEQVSGKIMDVVYVRYKGGTYIRRAPRVRKEARTPAMLQNQQRFACIQRFCTQFKDTLIPMIWNDRATKGSGYNLFMKANSPAFARDGSLSDPLLLKFSLGELSLPEALTAQLSAPDAGTIKVSWQKESHMGGLRLNDELMAISYDGENFSGMIPTGLKRKDLQGSFELPVMASGVQYLYLFFSSEDRRSFSESVAFKI